MKFEFSLDEVNILLTGLGKLPLEISLSTWAKLKQETEKQMNVPKEVKE